MRPSLHRYKTIFRAPAHALKNRAENPTVESDIPTVERDNPTAQTDKISTVERASEQAQS
jgi:hypothetical protein